MNESHTIISIGEYAFAWCSSLTSVKLPEGITSIGESAFCDCSNLISIDLPEGLTNIEDGVFSGCSSLESVDLPQGITTIGDSAFFRCGALKNINLSNNVTKIGSYAFFNSGLQTFTIGSNVTEIGAMAFGNCNELSEILIDEKNTNFINLNGNILSQDHAQLIWKSQDAASIVESLILKPSHIIIGEHAYGDDRYNWEMQTSYYEYRVPTGFVRGTLTFVDGMEREGTLEELYKQYNKVFSDTWNDYEYTEESDQSSENVWEPGEHSFFVSILGSEPAELKVTIKPEDERTDTISNGEADYKIDWKLMENVAYINAIYRLGELGIVKSTLTNGEQTILIFNDDSEEIAQYQLADLWREFKGEPDERIVLENASALDSTYYLLLKEQPEDEGDVKYLKLATKDGLAFQEVENELVEEEKVKIESDECTIYRWGDYSIAVSNSTEKNIFYYVSKDGKNWEKRKLPFENRYRAGVLKTTEKGVYFYTENESRYDFGRTAFQDFQCCYFTSDFENFTKVIESSEEEQWVYTLGANTEIGFLILAQQYPSEEAYTALRTCIFNYNESTNTMNTLWDTYDPVPTSSWSWGVPTNHAGTYEALPFYWENIFTWMSVDKGVTNEYVLNIWGDFFDGGSSYSFDALDDETGITRYKQFNIEHYAYYDNIGSLLLSGDYYATMWKLNTPEYDEGDWHVGRCEVLFGILFYTISYGDSDCTYMFNVKEAKDSLGSMIHTIYAIEKSGVMFQCTGTAVLDEETTIRVDTTELTQEDLAELKLEGNKATAYDVELLFHGESVDLGKGFRVFIDVPEGYNERSCSVYLLKPDGILKDMDAQLDEDGELALYTTESGRFIVVEKEGKGILGDVDGDGKVTADDALDILKSKAGLIKLDDDAKKVADVNADGNVDADDALDILKKKAGLIDKFKAETSA